jgi:nucleotide-binding universal stress UspA family protein
VDVASTGEPDPGDTRSRPALLCYDGSEPARRAIEQAGAMLGSGTAVVLTVWESFGSALLRFPLPRSTTFGEEVAEAAEEVVGAVDTGVAERAEATAAEGADLARRTGFDARPRALRAVSHAAERDDTTVWHAIVAAAEEEDAALVVLGSRGRSGIRSALLGSVSYGVVHHSARPVLIVPPPA